MFLHLPVSHSVHRGSLYDVTSCLAAWSHIPSEGVSVLCPMFLGGGGGRSVSRRGPYPGVSVQKGSLFRGVSVQGIAIARTLRSEKRAVRILLYMNSSLLENECLVLCTVGGASGQNNTVKKCSFIWLDILKGDYC